MRLLWVSVHGFKAYKNAVKIDLHPGANAVIGLNGSGKSSLLEAITLVVSEIYGRRVVDVKSVFHHGVRNASLSATIDLCFDNRDRRLSMYDVDEVVLSRKFLSGTAQTRKDQFLVLGKVVTKQEFAGLLETGGFSKTNPYYVIRQGKIMEMATMTDEGRMKLLKDFSGVQVYEDKRNQALSTLQMAQQKAKDADLLIQNLESRLAELQEQHREVCEYENLIRLADVYRVVVNDLDLANLDSQIEALDEEVSQIEVELNQAVETAEEDREEVQAQREQIRNAEKLVEEYRDRVEAVIIQNRTSRDRERLLAQAIDRSNQSRSVTLKKVTRLKEVLKKATTQLDSKKTKLENEIVPEISKLEDEGKALDIKTAEINLQRQKFNAKSDRGQFKSIKDRNQYVVDQLKLVETKTATEKALVDDTLKEIIRLEKSLEKLQKAQPEKELEAIDIEQTQLAAKAHQLNRKRAEMLRKEGLLQDQLRALSRQNDSRPKLEALSALQRACRWSTWKGNLTAMTWAFSTDRRLDELGVYEAMVERINSWIECEFDVTQPRKNTDPLIFGPWWALLSVPAQCRKATTQAVGVQMDNLVVWDDSVASSIHQELKKGQGSTTVTPLNQIVMRGPSRIPRYPKNTLTDMTLVDLDKELTFNKYDAIPLSNLIGSPDFLRPAVNVVTGRWLVCKNLDVGRKICSHSEFDCVTLQGDKVTHKGAVQGGHVSSHDVFTLGEEFERLIEQGKSKAEKLVSLQDQITQAAIDRASVASEITEITERLHQLEQSKIQVEASKGSQQRVKDETNNKLKQLRHRVGMGEANIQALEQSVKELNAVAKLQTMERLTRQDTDMITKLANDEEQLRLEYAVNKERLDDVQRLQKVVITDVIALEAQIRKDQAELAQLQTDVPDDEEEMEQVQQLEEAQKQREESELKEEEAKADLKKGENDLRRITQKIDGAQERLDTLNNRVDTLTQSKEFALKRKQTLELKRAQQMSERQNVILQAGQTDEEVEKLKKLPPKELRQMLHDVELQLSKAPRVNQKALADLITFQNELQNKIAHRAELLDGLRSVQELMLALDERRSRTLRNQFDKVNANLQVVFGKIVPGGRAKLIIKKLSEEKIEALRQARRSMQLALADGPPSGTPGTASDASQSQAWKLEMGQPGPEFANEVLHWDEVASGIEVKASFRPANDAPTEYFPLVALSGGQKTIVALSLIFAMQRCDRAPFYVLDEADAALDEAYRAAVAKLIQEGAKESQFLITTFRRELCEICDKHFHVTNVDRVAHVDVCDVQTALRVILEDAERSAAAVALEDRPEN